MTHSSLAARRVALPLSAAMLGGTLAAVGFAAPAHAAGSQAVNKAFAYVCQVYAGVDDPSTPQDERINLRTHNIPVRTQTKLPTTAYAGETIKPTPVTLTLAMPETLRLGSSLLGEAADGKSSNAAVTLASNGKSLTKVFTVTAAKTAIPPNPGADGQWTIPAKGTVPAILAPSYIASSIAATMPKSFNVTATIYNGSEKTPTTMACTTSADLALGSIKVVKDTTKPKFSKKSYAISTKKNKKKTITVKATDALGDKVTYKLVKKTKKGSVSVKGGKVTFKPKKNFKGKTSFYVGATDGRTGWVKVKVNVKVKK